MSRLFSVPGFRFHPTDAELVMYHLKRKLTGEKIVVNVIAEVNIYDYRPEDLPDLSSLKGGDLEWYFFCPKSKKYTSGSRINRTTEKGFWKATGKDRKVIHENRTVATIKTLIFHEGHAGKGKRTDWVMHEYRMEDEELAKKGIVQDTYVLCRIFKKSGSGPKNGAQYGAPFNEDEWDDELGTVGPVGASNSMDGKQKGPATTSMTEPGLSVVTLSANEPTNAPNKKRKCPATINMTEPGSSVVTSSANDHTNAQNYKQNGPATTNVTEQVSFTCSANEFTNTLNYQQNGPAMTGVTELGSSVVTVSSNGPTNTFDYKHKGPDKMNMSVPQVTHGSFVPEPGAFPFSANEPTNTLNYQQNDPTMTGPGSSVFMVSSNGPTNTLDYKQKGLAEMNMSVPQATYGFSVPEPGSSSVPWSTNEIPADDVICLDDIEVPEEWMDLISSDGFCTDGLENTFDEPPRPDDLGYTFDEFLRPDDPDPDMGNFVID